MATSTSKNTTTLQPTKPLKRASDYRNMGEHVRAVDLDDAENLGPPTDDSSTDGLLKADRLLQRCAVPRALDQIGCLSPRLAREGRGALHHEPPAQCLQQLVHLLVKAKQALLQLASLLNLLCALQALVHLVGRHVPVLIGVLNLLRPRVVHRKHINASANSEAKLPNNLSAVDLTMLRCHVNENSRSGC